MKKTFIRHSLIVALGLGLSQWAGALGLGPIQLAPGTYLGHPIRATIRVDGLNAANAAKTVVKLADQEAYATRGVAFSPSHQQLRFNLRKAGKGYVIDVRSVGGISDPLVNFIVTARNGDNVITREYSVFLDPEVKPMAGGNSRTPTQNFNRPAPPPVQQAQGQTPAVPALPPAGGHSTKRIYRQEPESMRGDGKGRLRQRDQRDQRQPPQAQGQQPVQPGQPPAQQPQPPVQPNANAGGAVNPANLQGNVYRVGQGDTLYSIANAFKPAGASTQQMIAAIKRNNPDAFYRGKLRANAQLTIPGEVGAYPKSEASSEQRTQKLRKRKKVASARRQRSAVNPDNYGYTIEDNSAASGSPVPPAPTAPSRPAAEEPNLKQGLGLGAALSEQPSTTAVAEAKGAGSNVSGSVPPNEQLAQTGTPPATSQPVPTPVLSQEAALSDNGQQGTSTPGDFPEQPVATALGQPGAGGTPDTTGAAGQMPGQSPMPGTPGDTAAGQPGVTGEADAGQHGVTAGTEQTPPPADPSPTVQLSPPEEGKDNITVVEERNPEEAQKPNETPAANVDPNAKATEAPAEPNAKPSETAAEPGATTKPEEANADVKPSETPADLNKPDDVAASTPSVTPATEPDATATAEAKPEENNGEPKPTDPNADPNKPVVDEAEATKQAEATAEAKPEDAKVEATAEASPEATPGEPTAQPVAEQTEQPVADQQQGAVDANAGEQGSLLGEDSPLWVLIAMGLAAFIVIGAMIYWIINRRKAKEYQEEPVEEMSAKEMEQIMSQIDAAEDKGDHVSQVRTVDNGDKSGKDQGQGAEADFFAENAPKPKSEAPGNSAASDDVNLDDFFKDSKNGAKAEPNPFQDMPQTAPSPERAPETLADKERQVNNSVLDDFFKSKPEAEVKSTVRDFPESETLKAEVKAETRANDLNSIDFGDLDEPAKPAAKPATKSDAMSFDKVDFGALDEPAKPAAGVKSDDNSSVDFTLDDADKAAPAASGAVDYEAFDINLDLAGALIEGGSGEQMRSALEEVLAKGLPDQKVIAQDLLNKLDGRA